VRLRWSFKSLMLWEITKFVNGSIWLVNDRGSKGSSVFVTAERVRYADAQGNCYFLSTPQQRETRLPASG
jgi:hypothetical protein